MSDDRFPPLKAGGMSLYCAASAAHSLHWFTPGVKWLMILSHRHDHYVVILAGVWVCDMHMFVSQRRTEHQCFVPPKYGPN